MRFKTQIRESELVSWKASTVNRLLISEFAKLGRFWHRVIRQRHFKRGAFLRYGYTARSKTYVRIKKKRVRHSDPLRLSDETRRASEQHRVLATRKGVSVTYSSVRKLNFRPRGSKVNMRKEFETVSRKEEIDMGNRMARSTDRKLQTAARNGGRYYVRS